MHKILTNPLIFSRGLTFQSISLLINLERYRLYILFLTQDGMWRG